MINRIDLKDFKCFDNLKLPLANLTVLSGTNASGKSSVLQAMVLLHQTMRGHEWSTRLLLNDATIKLGTVGDVVDKVNGRRNIGVGIVDGELDFSWVFSGERSDMSMNVEQVSIGGNTIENPKVLQHLLPPLDDLQFDTLAIKKLSRSLCDLTYITAERIGPREFYSIDETANVVGPAGEHAVCVLHLGREEHVLFDLLVDGVPPTRLRQVEARMRQFFPGCGLIVNQIPQANAVTFGLRTSEDTDFHRPIHVGFGLTQILPIVVAALSAKSDDILIIENPEVHLHPAGQALMGQFLSSVAKAGVQVILETHSDHILNGIRRSVKNEILNPDQVAIHFFRQRSKDAPQVSTPQLDHNGNIDTWPEGFFDQYDKDMNYFAGWDV